MLAKREGDYLSQVPSNVNLVDIKASKLAFSTNLLGSYLRETKPDVLISANERVNIVALMARKLYRPKTRVIISVHTNNTEQIANRDASFYKKIVLKIARLVYKWADQVVAVSEGVARDAIKIFKLSPDNVTVIYNPIVTSEINDKMKMQVDHPWFNRPGGPVIIGVGRLVAQKDFFTLVDSFVEVKKASPDAKLIILGEGEKRKALENKISALGLKNDVSLPGFVENPYSYLHNASVFVLSSAWEGFGNVLVEAMATGTPVVSTDCPSGPSEILDKGRYGPLVPPGDAEKLAHSIIAVLNKPPEPALLKRRASNFTVGNAVNEYIELINHRGINHGLNKKGKT